MKNDQFSFLTSSYIHAYFRTFDEENAIKRGAKDAKESESLYRKSLKPLYPSSETLLQGALDQADHFLKPYIKLSNIPWKFATFSLGEFPYPHTHGDMIFLPEGWTNKENNLDIIYQMSITLIHEKLHIYQRMYPLYTHLFLLQVWNMQIDNSVDHFSKGYENVNVSIRRNPDTNNFIYKDAQNNSILPYFKQMNKNDSHEITDKRDHPFEQMAYVLADYIAKVHKPSSKEKEWMNKYL